jgi:hypothetical protein
MKDEEWTMKDGTKIMVEDMSESHAKNCLRVLMRRIDKHNAGNAAIRFHRDIKSLDNDLDSILHDDYGDRQ